MDRALALRDVMSHVVDVEKEAKKAPRAPNSGSGTTWLLVVCVPLLAFAAWSWIARPEFIWGADPKNAPPKRVEADARIGMYLTSRRIETYRKQNGHLPGTLRDVGDRTPGLTYDAINDSVFELRMSAAGKLLVMKSNEPASNILGNSAAVIMGHDR